VTGAAGFIGSNLVKELAARGNTVIGLWRGNMGGPWFRWLQDSVMKAGCSVVRGDLSNFALLRRVMAEYQIDQVYHLGAWSLVKTAMNDPLGVFQSNVMGTVNILEAARLTKVKKSLVLVTDKIFGNMEQASPDSAYVVTEPYSASKICQDVVADSYTRSYGMEIIRVRACNVYGYDFNDRIIPNTIRKALKWERPVVYLRENTKRQYVYVADLAEALITIMETKRRGIWNVATEDIFTQEEVVKRILSLPDFKGMKPEYIKREAPTEIKSQSLKASDFGWAPRHKFMQGIEKTVKIYKEYGF